jgi:hypothetical protein
MGYFYTCGCPHYKKQASLPNKLFVSTDIYSFHRKHITHYKEQTMNFLLGLFFGGTIVFFKDEIFTEENKKIMTKLFDGVYRNDENKDKKED